MFLGCLGLLGFRAVRGIGEARRWSESLGVLASGRAQGTRVYQTGPK